MAVSIIGPKFYAFDNETGNPLAFGKVYTYQAGTNTPKATFQSEDAVTENTNPVVLNGAGYADIYLIGSYKIVVKDADGVDVWTADPVSDPSGLQKEWQSERAATQVSPTSFTLVGNYTDVYQAGKAVKMDDATIIYGHIDSVQYLNGNTVVEVTADSSLTSDLSRAWVSLLTRRGLPESVGRFITATSIAEIAAYSAPVGYVFSLNAGGRSGVFDVVAGDFSTELAADTLNGVYVGLADNPTGTNKVAKRRGSTAFNVNWFGAIGNGSYDNSDSFQACANLASASSIALNQVVTVNVPAGDYRLSSRAVFDVSLGAGARGIVLNGAGMHSTRLVADESNTDGCIKMTSDGNIELFEVNEISFVSTLNYDSATSNGVALLIQSTLTLGDGGWGEQVNRTVYINKVFIGPYGDTILKINGGEVGNFSKGIEIRNKWWPVIQDSFLLGSDEQLLENMTGRKHAIHCYKCYSPEFIHNQIVKFWENGIFCEQNEDEDFRLQDSFLVGQYKGFVLIHPQSSKDNLYEPGGAISNNHIYSHKAGLHIRYHRQVLINNNYFYVPRGNELNQGQTGLPSSIWLEGTADITINDNQFLEPGFYVDEGNSSVGIKCIYRAIGVNILDNHFNSGGTGVYLSSDILDSVIIEGNNFGGMTVWGSIVKKVNDKSEVAIFSNTWFVPGFGSATRTTESMRAPSNGAAIADIISSTRSDYATKSDAKILDRSVYGTLSDGSSQGITEAFGFDDNTEAAPKLYKKIFFKTSEGITATLKITPPDVAGETCLTLLWFNGTSLIIKPVLVGDADSGGTGYRALIIGN